MLSTDALQAAVPGMLVSSTLQAVTGATALPAAVAVLVEGGMRQMFLIKLKTIVTAVVVLCLALAGAGTAAHHVLVSGDSGPGNPTESVSLPPAQDQPPGAKVAPKNSPRPADKEPPKNDKPKQPAPKSKSGPPGVPLEITLKSRKDTYTLDRGGKSAAEYLELIKNTNKGGDVFPPPEVDLTVEVRNTGNKEITFWTAGDPLKLMLELKGPSAYNTMLPFAFRTELRLPKGTAFGPGKSHTFKLSSLRFGFRGASHAAYWTEEGEYTLGATLETGVSPIPRDAKEYQFDKTYGLVTLSSAPIKVKVVLKGKEKDKEKPPAAKSKSEPPGVPLEIVLKSGKDTYVLDRGGKSAAECLDQIKKTIEGGEVFLPPEVDLTIEVRNTGNKEITFWTAGDPLKLMLELKGPGAYNATLPIDFTYELRLPKGTAFAPGKSHTFNLSSLRFGFRGDSHAAYWTEEGEYTLSATLQTGVSPIPKDAKEYHFDKTYGLVSLTSTPIKLKVVLKGKDKEKGKAPAAPLELSLKLGMEKYTLDRGGLTAAEYVKAIKTKDEGDVFPPPEVGLRSR
jgi:hypothetical protein